MNIINQHIRRHLLNIKFESDYSFEEIFKSIVHESKDNHYHLLKYIHLLLNEVFDNHNAVQKVLHVHFEYEFNNDTLLIISQYILVRLFNENYRQNTVSIQNNDELQKLKINLLSKKSKLSTCPPGASGVKKNKEWKQWKSEKNNIESLINFYSIFDDNKEIRGKNLFNCQVSLVNSLNNIYDTRPYARQIGSYSNILTYNLLNTKLTINSIDEIDSSFIDNLDMLILFDCERKKIMQYFSLQDMVDYEITLKKYLIITFGTKNASIQSFREKINLINHRFKISGSNTYPITRFEIDYALKRKLKKNIPASFIGLDKSHIWDTFMLETKISDMYELRSIKMMNIYSLCVTHEIKDYILQEIFSVKNTNDLIGEETKLRLLYLRSDDMLALRDSLSSVLDLIISSELKNLITSKVKNESALLVDNSIINAKKFIGLISSALSLSEKNRFITWAHIDTAVNCAVIILSYQDQGKYPYYFYPNIIEATVSKSIIVEALYHKFLFFARYEWAKYNIAKDICKLTDHPVRIKYFNWNTLTNSVDNLRPKKADETNWDLEQQYSGVMNRETIKVKFEREREKTFNSSELFIFNTSDDSSYRVEKLGIIISYIDHSTTYYAQNLESIQESINIYEKIIDTKQQEEELDIIRKQFDIDSESTGRLWKILLRKKASSSSYDLLYNSLKQHLESKNLRIVSLSHFKNNWINPESESIAPISKKVFIEVCEFLGLPKVYFVLIQRLRNVAKQSTQLSTRQMNRLLQCLFNDNCFDSQSNINEIIKNKLENYKKNHPLDDLGIDEKYLANNLIALVELIKPEISLKKIEKIRKTDL